MTESPLGPPLALAVTALAVMAGCGGDDGRFAPPDRVEIPPEAVRSSFGELDDTTGVEVFNYLYGAALSESGRYMALASRSPPSLRVLDRRTDSAWSFGPDGEGPGEIRAAYGVEFVGDTALLVLSGGHRIERFGVRGAYLGGRRLADTGLRVADITAGCGGRIYAYGHPAEYRHLDAVPWVHELILEEEVSSRSLLELPGTDFRFGWGGLGGFDGTEAGVLYWDKAQSPQVGFWLPCGRAEPGIFSHRATGEIRTRTDLEGREGKSGQAFTLPDTLFAGAAARGSTKIWARKALEPEDGIRVTTLQVVGGGECREMELRGTWSLHDAHSDGLLLYTSDPVPAVKLVDWSWFEGRLTRVRCRA